MATSTEGPLLEARAQRLFLAQGSFAERGLVPSATADRRMLATDIDVLVSEYVSGFHETRRHIECKAGKYSLLDRVLWLNGVRHLVRADSTYLIATEVDLRAAEFARALDVELFTVQHLEAWEKSLGIPADMWPCRSDFETFDRARHAWSRASGAKEADETWRVLRAALAFVEIDSWLTFRYRLVNRLFRLVGEIVALDKRGALDQAHALCARYIFSALLVRLSQHMLAICADVAGILPVDVEKYLTARLTFGDQDPNQAADLVQSTVTWIQRALRLQGTVMPPEIEPSRLHAPPPYASEFVELVRRILNQSHEARYLPLAMERLQFGSEAEDRLTRFRAAAGTAESLAVLVKAFVVRALVVPNALTGPVRQDLATAHRTSWGGGSGGSSGEGSIGPSRTVRTRAETSCSTFLVAVG